MKPNYNAVLILEAIAKAPIPDEVKLKAVNDLEKMYVDKEYGSKCNVNRLQDNDRKHPNLLIHHTWFKSDLGLQFWEKMNQIISQ